MTYHILPINLLKQTNKQQKKMPLQIIVRIHRLTSSKIVTQRKMVVVLQSNCLW